MQSEFADTFITMMLGWIRQLAASVANMFQSGAPSQMSSGSSVLNWFSANWIGLLVALVALGLLIDWIVWMARWRPYWLWFHKRRILLDDDIDEDLNDTQLQARYTQRAVQRPHFESARNRAAEQAQDEAYAEDSLLDEADEDSLDFAGEGVDFFDDTDFVVEPAEPLPEDELDIDDLWADEQIEPPEASPSSPIRFGRRERRLSDPFSMDDGALDGLDDEEFLKVLSSDQPKGTKSAAALTAENEDWP